VLYQSLDEALGNVAERSFCEQSRVTKVAGGYDVEDWYTGAPDSVLWTYEGGADLSGIPHAIIDFSRTMEPWERFDTAQHVRLNLPVAVDAIEAGESVGFTYIVTEAICLDPDICDDGYHLVGWLLVATLE
jgi:hypothetical protein